MKTKILVLFIFCNCIFSIAVEAQSYQWAKQYATWYSSGIDVVADNNLNIISAGKFMDSVDLDPGPGAHWVYDSNDSPYHSSYLSKLDQNGSFVWGYAYYDTAHYSDARIHSIDVDNQDNIIVMGHFRDSIDLDFSVGTYKLYKPNNVNNFYNSIFIAKYDPNGNLIWGKGLHCNDLRANGLKVDANNNVVLLGFFQDTVDFDPGPGVYNLVGPSVGNTTVRDQFLLKLSAAGNFVWVREWNLTYVNSSHWTTDNQLDVDVNNNIFFPVDIHDSVDVDPLLPISMVYANGFFSNVSLLKVSPSGNMLWHKEIGSCSNQYCNSLATDPTGNIFYSIQSSNSFQCPSSPAPIPLDMDPGPGIFMLSWPNTITWGKAILKLDNNGNFIWALKNPNGGYSQGFATDTAGSLYLTTNIDSSLNSNTFDLDPGPNNYLVSSAGWEDVTIQNLDANGNFVWGGVIGGTFRDWSIDIYTDKARGVYLTGYFRGQSDFDPTPDTSYMTSTPYGRDAFVVKLNNCNVSKSTVYQSCDSVIYNSQVFYNDTVLRSHYTAWNGCDSAHSIVIDVKTLTNDTLVVDTCWYYLWNNTTYTNSGIYTHNFGLPTGCDSIVTLVLTLHNSPVQTINVSGCDSVTVNGLGYNHPGQYVQSFTNIYGCDSNYIVNFTKTVDTSITITGGASLVANATSATYQWIDCITMMPIAGETNVFFNAPQTGIYACIVTQNGCTDTSGCYSMDVWPNAVQDYSIVSKIYPNPSKGSYHLQLDKEYKNVQLEIRSMSGQLVWKQDYKKLKETDLNINNAAGVYMLYIKQGERTQVKKLLKW